MPGPSKIDHGDQLIALAQMTDPDSKNESEMQK